MSAHNMISELSEAVGPTGIGTSQGKCFVWVSGAPTAGTAGFAKGCLAIRVDGSSASTRAYINSGTNAVSAWVSVTTSG